MEAARAGSVRLLILVREQRAVKNSDKGKASGNPAPKRLALFLKTVNFLDAKDEGEPVSEANIADAISDLLRRWEPERGKHTAHAAPVEPVYTVRYPTMILNTISTLLDIRRRHHSPLTSLPSEITHRGSHSTLTSLTSNVTHRGRHSQRANLPRLCYLPAGVTRRYSPLTSLTAYVTHR